MTIEPKDPSPTRRLSAVLLADVVGYSRMMSHDEEGTHARISAYVRDLIEPTVGNYRGRFARSMGDGTLIEFASALDAVRCALDIQRGLAERQGDDSDRIQLRIGINTGDVLVDERDIYGNSVNITARLEALANPGTVCVSQSIYDQTRSQPELFFADRGQYRAKNIPYPVQVWQVAYEPIRVPLIERVLSRRAGITIVATVGSIAVAATGALLTTGHHQVTARTNTIIVLPFKNVDGNPQDDYLADAITDDLTTELSRVRSAFVIAAATAFSYKGKAVDARQIGDEVGARYALEGSVKRAGAIVQVNAQLVDTTSGTNLWADRFRHETGSLLDLQEAVAGRIARSLNDQLARPGSRQEQVGSFLADGNPLDERLKAMAASTGMNTPEKSLEARRHAENGLNGNPHDGHLWGLLANVLVSDYLNNWNGAGKAEVDRAEEAANKAASLDANVALAHYSLGFIRRVRGDHDGALAAFSKAIEIDPNLAKAYAQKANELVFTGKPRDAIPLADQAAKLSPKDPSIGVFYWVKGRAYFAMGEYQNAIEWLAKSTEVRPNLWFSQAWLTAAYALTNRDTDAQAARQKLETNFKRFNLAHITDIYSKDSQYNNPTLKRASAELIKGLQEAGLK